MVVMPLLLLLYTTLVTWSLHCSSSVLVWWYLSANWWELGTRCWLPIVIALLRWILASCRRVARMRVDWLVCRCSRKLAGVLRVLWDIPY